MKTCSILSLFMFSLVLCKGQAVIKKPTNAASVKTILDFGAKANDGKDDTWAFIKAGKYFSNLWDVDGVPLKSGVVNFDYSKFSAQLNIPEGTFNVGRLIDVPPQGLSTTYGAIFGYSKATATLSVPAGAAHQYGLELFVLQNRANNISEFTMKGQGKSKSKVKYNDNLITGYYGNNKAPMFFPKTAYDNKYVVSVGHFFFTEGSKNIILQDFEVDGNNSDKSHLGTMRYAGGWDSHLIQIGAIGFHIKNTQNVTISRTNIHHMTLDGIMFQDYYKDPSLYPGQSFSNLLIQNSNFNYNRRQGFSWIGGRKISVVNSTFNYTGTTTAGVGAGNPAAGIDIEPEKDAFGNTTWCIDGKFINCESVDNVGLALGNDYTDFSKNMIFENCLFHDVTGYAVWIKGKQYSFNNCKIWGGFVYGNEGQNNEDATIFNNCDFADEELAGRPGIYNKGYDLVGSWRHARRMKFNNCTFRTLHIDQKLATIYAPSAEETEFNIFSNCRFVVGSKSNGNNIFFGTIFDGSNSFTSNNTTQTEVVNINGAVFTGSRNACNPYYFTVAGRVMLHPANSHGMGLTQFIIGRNGLGSKLTDGFTNFIIGRNSGLYSYWSQQIDIGKNAKLINSSGAQLAMLSGSINNSGIIILDKESNTWFGNPVVINNSSEYNAEFRLDKAAELGLNKQWAAKLTGFNAKGIPIDEIAWSDNSIIDGANPKSPGRFKARLVPELNGFNQFVIIPNTSAQSKLSNYGAAKSFSIEIRFRRSDALRKETLFSQGGFSIFFKGARLNYSLPGVSLSTATDIIVQASVDQEQLISFIKNADGFINIYFNGTLRHTSSKKIMGNVSSKHPVILGAQMQNPKNYFKGEIIQARIWNRAISDQEICYSVGRKMPMNFTSLLGYWGVETLENSGGEAPVAGKLLTEAIR